MLSQVGREHVFSRLLRFPPQLRKQSMAGVSALAYHQRKVLDCTARLLGWFGTFVCIACTCWETTSLILCYAHFTTPNSNFATILQRNCAYAFTKLAAFHFFICRCVVLHDGSMLLQVGREHVSNGLLRFPPQLRKQNMAGASALACHQSKGLNCTTRMLGQFGTLVCVSCAWWETTSLILCYAQFTMLKNSFASILQRNCAYAFTKLAAFHFCICRCVILHDGSLVGVLNKITAKYHSHSQGQTRKSNLHKRNFAA